MRTRWPCHPADGSRLSSSDSTHSTSRVLWVRSQAGAGGPSTLQSPWAVVTSRLSWVRTCGQAPVVVGGIQGLLASGPRAAPSPCSGDLLASRRHGLECHVLGGDICHSFCLEESPGLSPPQGGVCRIMGPAEGTHASVHGSGGVADSAGQMQMLDRVTRPDGRQGRTGGKPWAPVREGLRAGGYTADLPSTALGFGTAFVSQTDLGWAAGS